MNASVRGWHAASVVAGVTTSMARRLVGRGELRAVKRGNAYEFAIADLDALRESRHSSDAPTDPGEHVNGATLYGGDVRTTAVLSTTAASDEHATVETDVRELATAAVRERALTAKLNAEVERLRAEYARDELVRAHRELERTRRVEEIVRRAVFKYDGAERDRLGLLLRQRLANVDVHNRLMIASSIAYALDDVREQAEARRQSEAARLRGAKTSSVPSDSIWRGARIHSVVVDVANELRNAGIPPTLVENAASAAAYHLTQLDSAVLETDWAEHVARSSAAWLLGLPFPS